MLSPCVKRWKAGRGGREQRTRNRRNGGHRPPFLGFFQPRLLPGRKWTEREGAAPASGYEKLRALLRRPTRILFGIVILDPDPAARKRGGTRGGLIDRRKSTGRLSTRSLLLHPPRDIVNFRYIGEMEESFSLFISSTDECLNFISWLIVE